MDGTPQDFEPLVPEDRVVGGLRELAHSLQKEAWQLAGFSHSSVRRALKPMLRAMNSYYTNLIEGQHTSPADIARAMRNDFSAKPAEAAKQWLAVAHIRTEEWAEETFGTRPPSSLFGSESILALHGQLYGQLPSEDRITPDGKIVEPGQLRVDDVTVGRHKGPSHSSVPRLLEHFADRYSALPAGENLLIGVACAHRAFYARHASAGRNAPEAGRPIGVRKGARA